MRNECKENKLCVLLLLRILVFKIRMTYSRNNIIPVIFLRSPNICDTSGGHWTFQTKTTPRVFSVNLLCYTRSSSSGTLSNNLSPKILKVTHRHPLLNGSCRRKKKNWLTILFALSMHWCNRLDIQKTSNLLTLQQKLTSGLMLDAWQKDLNASNKDHTANKDILILRLRWIMLGFES